MKLKRFVGLLAFCALTLHGATCTLQDALSPDTPPQTHFTLDSYIRSFLRQSPQVKAEYDTLLNARANYQNARIQAFLPSFSVSATADKTYGCPDYIRSWHALRPVDSGVQAAKLKPVEVLKNE